MKLLFITIIGIFLLFIIVKYVTKIILKIVILIILIILGYLIFKNYGCKRNKEKDSVFNELKDKYCVGNDGDKKCECIIEILYEDLRQRYPSEEDIKKLKNDKIKSIQELLKSYKNKKEDIYNCLKEKKSLYLWDDFVKEMSGYRNMLKLYE